MRCAVHGRGSQRGFVWSHSHSLRCLAALSLCRSHGFVSHGFISRNGSVLNGTTNIGSQFAAGSRHIRFVLRVELPKKVAATARVRGVRSRRAREREPAHAPRRRGLRLARRGPPCTTHGRAHAQLPRWHALAGATSGRAARPLHVVGARAAQHLHLEQQTASRVWAVAAPAGATTTPATSKPSAAHARLVLRIRLLRLGYQTPSTTILLHQPVAGMSAPRLVPTLRPASRVPRRQKQQRCVR
jgi:hypothetical protein